MKKNELRKYIQQEFDNLIKQFKMIFNTKK